MRIAIGCDHIVTDIKDKVVALYKEKGFEVIDCGTNDFTRTHYPIYGARVASKVLNSEADFGVVICGTGVGITTSATKIKNIRSILTQDVMLAKKAREDYDANIIGFGGRISGLGIMEEMIDTFVNTKYLGQNDEEIAFLNSLGRENFKEEEFNDYLTKWDNGEYHD